MRIIITGGTGLIGTLLAQELAAEGHEVIVLSRNPAKYTLPAGVRGERWDAKTAAGWGHLADGAGAIVNLAGESIAGSGLLPSRWTPARKERIRQSRIDAGQAVVEAVQAAAAKPAVVIQASGIDYYGDVQSDAMLSEDAPAGDNFLAGVTVDWENATAAVEAMGVRRVVMRTGLVLSMDGGALPITVLPFRLFVGGPLGNGRQWWSWLHLEDQVRAIRFFIEQGNCRGVFNVCTPNPLPNKEFARVIGQVLQRPSLLPVPAFALRLLLGEIAAIVLHGRRAVPSKLQAAGFTFQFPELKDALQDLLV